MMASFLRCTQNGKGDGWLLLLLSGTEQKWENLGTEFLISNALTASRHRQIKSQFWALEPPRASPRQPPGGFPGDHLRAILGGSLRGPSLTFLLAMTCASGA